MFQTDYHLLTWLHPLTRGICIGYTMEKCGVCAHITKEFVVIPRGTPPSYGPELALFPGLPLPPSIYFSVRG